MGFWVWVEKGLSVPSRKTLGQRFSAWVGYRLAKRHSQVFVDKSSGISPNARINPREGSIHIGQNCLIANGTILQGNIQMGNNCSVQASSILIGYGSKEKKEGIIQIGNHVRIAPNVMIIAANHNFSDLSKPISCQGLTLKPVVIEDDVWVGGRVSIMAGVTIGTGSVIGAGSVVTRDIPPYSVAVGVPAKVIKNRN